MRLAFSKKPERKIAVALLVSSFLLAAAFLLYQSRQAEIQRTFNTADNLVQLLSLQTLSAFQAADVTLKSIRERIARSPPPSDDPELRLFMRSMLAELPYVRALFVVGSDGSILHDTDYPDTPRVSLADRDYFVTLRDTPGVELYVGHALVSRSVKSWFVPVARRIGLPDGEFGGVVVAALEPQFFEQFYMRLNLSPDDSVALFHSESALIARMPPMPEMYGRQWWHLPLFADELRKTPVGTFRTRNMKGADIVVGYASVPGYPLVVTVSAGLSAALKGWWRNAFLVGSASVIAVVLAIWLLNLLERRMAERQIVRRRKTLSHKLEEIGQMTGTIAHDFNNVLGAVSGGVNLIRRRGPREEYLTGVEQAVQRGARLTAQLLAFAKRQEPGVIEADLNDLLRSLELVIRQGVGRLIEVKFKLGHEPSLCRVDQGQFDAAIVNLTMNAAQAMPEGGCLTVTTHVETGADGGRTPMPRAVVRVQDTGEGISPENLRRVFEPYFTTKEGSGTGLGLPQVQAFARQFGGDVKISSSVGEGTTVELSFPCVLRQAPDSPSLGDHAIHEEPLRPAEGRGRQSYL